MRLVQLCLSYNNMPRGRRLRVRWFLNNESEPLSTSTFEADGNGDLMSSFTREPEILPGLYRVTVSFDDRELGRARFVVRRR